MDVRRGSRLALDPARQLQFSGRDLRPLYRVAAFGRMSVAHASHKPGRAIDGAARARRRFAAIGTTESTLSVGWNSCQAMTMG